MKTFCCSSCLSQGTQKKWENRIKLNAEIPKVVFSSVSLCVCEQLEEQWNADL